jgi:PDDEXK-like domain of unknown function (DUF3799)
MSVPTFAPGLHRDIPAPTYHAAEGLSNSTLKDFRAWGPHKWKWLRDHPQPRASTPAQERGTLFHLAVFEVAKFGEGISHHVRPPDLSFATKEGKAWKAEHADLPLLTVDENANIRGAAAALRADDFAGPMLNAKGMAEVSAFAIHPDTGLLTKCRVDWLTEDAEGAPWILDAKSCESLDGFPYNAREYSYDVQSVFYTDLLAGLPEPIEGTRFLFAAVELTPPFDLRLEIIAADDLRAARMLYAADLASIADCTARGAWPRKYPAVGSLKMPRRWTAEREEGWA